MSIRLESIVRLARRIVRIVRAIVIGRVLITDEPVRRDGPPPRIVRMAVVAAPTRRALPESMWEPASRAPYREADPGVEELGILARQCIVTSLRECGYDDRGHKGTGVSAFRALTRSAFKEHAELAFMRAEDGCRGALLTAEGERKGINPRDLFHGRWAYAQKWASEELLEWWERHERRLTYAEFADDLLRSGIDEAREAREVA